MNYSSYGNTTTYHTAILTGSQNHEYQDVFKHYMEPLDSLEGVIVLTLDTLPKRTPKKIIRECWEEVEDFLKEEGIKTLIISDTDYYKHIINQTKVGGTLGIRMTVPNFDVFYIPNYKALFYDPDNTQKKIDIALKSIKDHMAGCYVEPGTDIVESAEYIDGYNNFNLFKSKLQSLHNYPALTCDIETYSLAFYDAGLGSIAFAWDKQSGMAFYINNSKRCVEELAKFFKEYTGDLIFHNAAFDLTVLIYDLYMNRDLGNQKGLLEGLGVFKGTHCTRIMTYLATNSCAGNELGLKTQAQDFAGNYAEDVTDITAIPVDALLEYNLVDCLATWYVWEIHSPTIMADKQQDVYDMFIKWQTDILQMQLTGMPLHMPSVIKAQDELDQIYQQATDDIMDNKYVIDFINIMKGEWVIHKNETLKKKRVTLDDAADISFNHKSSPQLGRLLYEVIGLPVVDYTKSGEPATGKTTLDKLLKHTEDDSVKALIDNLILAKDSSKILEAFIPVFRRAPYSVTLKSHMLYGNFMLGGTVSGRLSANSPNLQQVPSRGRFAGLIKNCFKAPEGYLFVGLDFDSLEDRISALTTKDPNKLKVYMGHDVYEVKIGNTVHHIRDDDTINFDGKSYTGKEFYEAHCKP